MSFVWFPTVSGCCLRLNVMLVGMVNHDSLDIPMWAVGAAAVLATVVWIVWQTLKPSHAQETFDPWEGSEETGRTTAPWSQPGTRPANEKSGPPESPEGAGLRGSATPQARGFLERFLLWLLRSGLLKVTTKSTFVVDPNTGERRSLDALPPAQRAAIESALAGGETATAHKSILLNELPEIHGQIDQLKGAEGGFVFVDHTGQRRVYRSLEEAPPEIRAKVESLREGTGKHDPNHPAVFKNSVRVEPIGEPKVQFKFGSFGDNDE